MKAEELPEPWGLYVASEDRARLKTVKVCVPFPDRDKATMRRSFAAAMLRKVGETTVPKAELARLVEEGVKAAIERTPAGHDLSALRDEVQRLKNILDGFKARTGVDLQHWEGHQKISAAVDVVLRGEDYRRQLLYAQAELERIAKDVRKALGQWPELSVEEPALRDGVAAG